MDEVKLHQNYRIVESIEKSGKRWYQVEERFLWFFWRERFLRKESQAEAEACIEYLIKEYIKEVESKIVSKNIYYYNR